MTLALLSIELLTGMNQSRQYHREGKEYTENQETTHLSHESISKITEETGTMVNVLLRRHTNPSLSDIIIRQCFGTETEACNRVMKNAFLEEGIATRPDSSDLDGLLDDADGLLDIGAIFDFRGDEQKQIPAQFDSMKVGEPLRVKFEKETISKWIKFDIQEEQEYKIYTKTGSSALADPAIALYKQQDDAKYLNKLEDDDGGDGLDAIINITLDQEICFLNLYEFSSPEYGGEYDIHITTSNI